MNRIIKGITEKTAARIIDELTSRAITCTVPNEAPDLIDILLDDYVIVKCFDDEMFLDFGGKLARIKGTEFVEFTFK